MKPAGQIEIFPSLKEAGSRFAKFEVIPGAARKERVTNRTLLQQLRQALPGLWMKVYKLGVDGRELHYFKHKSGAVALPKIKRGYVFK